jgi:hypothetical protein
MFFAQLFSVEPTRLFTVPSVVKKTGQDATFWMIFAPQWLGNQSPPLKRRAAYMARV